MCATSEVKSPVIVDEVQTGEIHPTPHSTLPSSIAFEMHSASALAADVSLSKEEMNVELTSLVIEIEPFSSEIEACDLRLSNSDLPLQIDAELESLSIDIDNFCLDMLCSSELDVCTYLSHNGSRSSSPTILSEPYTNGKLQYSYSLPSRLTEEILDETKEDDDWSFDNSSIYISPVVKQKINVESEDSTFISLNERIRPQELDYVDNLAPVSVLEEEKQNSISGGNCCISLQRLRPVSQSTEPLSESESRILLARLEAYHEKNSSIKEAVSETKFQDTKPLLTILKSRPMNETIMPDEAPISVMSLHTSYFSPRKSKLREFFENELLRLNSSLSTTQPAHTTWGWPLRLPKKTVNIVPVEEQIIYDRQPECSASTHPIAQPGQVVTEPQAGAELSEDIFLSEKVSESACNISEEDDGETVSYRARLYALLDDKQKNENSVSLFSSLNDISKTKSPNASNQTICGYSQEEWTSSVIWDSQSEQKTFGPQGITAVDTSIPQNETEQTYENTEMEEGCVSYRANLYALLDEEPQINDESSSSSSDSEFESARDPCPNYRGYPQTSPSSKPEFTLQDPQSVKYIDNIFPESDYLETEAKLQFRNNKDGSEFSGSNVSATPEHGSSPVLSPIQIDSKPLSGISPVPTDLISSFLALEESIANDYEHTRSSSLSTAHAEQEWFFDPPISFLARKDSFQPLGILKQRQRKSWSYKHASHRSVKWANSLEQIKVFKPSEKVVSTKASYCTIAKIRSFFLGKKDKTARLSDPRTRTSNAAIARYFARDRFCNWLKNKMRFLRRSRRARNSSSEEKDEEAEKRMAAMMKKYNEPMPFTLEPNDVLPAGEYRVRIEHYGDDCDQEQQLVAFTINDNDSETTSVCGPVGHDTWMWMLRELFVLSQIRTKRNISLLYAKRDKAARFFKNPLGHISEEKKNSTDPDNVPLTSLSGSDRIHREHSVQKYSQEVKTQNSTTLISQSVEWDSDDDEETHWSLLSADSYYEKVLPEYVPLGLDKLLPPEDGDITENTGDLSCRKKVRIYPRTAAP